MRFRVIHLGFILLTVLTKISYSQDPTCSQNEILINNVCRCIPPNVRIGDSCQTNCPPLTFLDLRKYSCEPCDSSCSECWGPEPNQCLSCAGSLLFNPFSGICETSGTCRQGVNGGRGFCVGSAASCANLTSDTPFINAATGDCNLTCNLPYDVLGSNENPYNLCGFGQCDASCGINPESQKRQCLGQWQPGTCLWCNTATSVRVHVAVTSNGQDIYSCANTPPQNSYFSAQEDRYYFCNPRCSSCSDSPDNCLTCDEGLGLTSNGSCIEQCPPGSSLQTNANGERICTTPNPEPTPIARQEKAFSESVVNYNNAGGTSLSVGVAGLQIISPGTPSIVSTILLVNLLQYIRYLSINYPKTVEDIFTQQTQNIGSLNFGPMVPSSIENEATQYKSLSRFDRFGVNGLFLINFWRGVTTSIILALVAGLALYLKRIAFKNEKLIMIQDQIKSLLLWNFLITFVLSNIDNVSIFAIIEYQTLNLDDALSTASFLLNLIYLLASLSLLAYIPLRLYKLRKQDPYKDREEKIKNNDSIKVFFEKFKNKYFMQEIFLFMIGMRTLLNNIIIAAFDAPIVQCSLLMVLGLSMIAYLAIYQPNVSVLDNVELIVYEVILLTVNCTCLFLSVLESLAQHNAEHAGDTILMCNIIAMTFSLVMSVLKVLVEGWIIIKKKLAERKAQKLAEANNKAKQPNGKDKDESNEIPDESINLEVKAPRFSDTITSLNNLNTCARSEVLDSKR